LCLAKG
jgi:hypothetical protein